ncbi:MAG TPA: hypothetical protein VEL74_02050 [Thermoanaerobaculia bacterium]|nr:hypothetical protein [Thermoanaerobaculia bacterium]
MATDSTHQRMEQVMSAISEGTAGAAMSQRARDWLLVRYTRWMGKRRIRDDERTPEEAWSEYESAFLTKFREIGSKAAELSGGSEIDQSAVRTAALTVEASTPSPCPFCQPPDVP